jgi:hypothetical protein
MVAFGDGFRTFLADIISVFKENYPALEKYSLLTNFFGWLSSLLRRVFYYPYQSSKIESYGASKVGTVFLYILVATIGTHMNLGAILDNPYYS